MSGAASAGKTEPPVPQYNTAKPQQNAGLNAQLNHKLFSQQHAKQPSQPQNPAHSKQPAKGPQAPGKQFTASGRASLEQAVQNSKAQQRQQNQAKPGYKNPQQLQQMLSANMNMPLNQDIRQQLTQSQNTAESPAPTAAHQSPALLLPVYQGPFNVNCTTNKEPTIVMNEIFKALESLKVQFKKSGPYGVKCQKTGINFSMELNHMEDLASILVVKFKRLSGEMRDYRELSSKVLGQMQLV